MRHPIIALTLASTLLLQGCAAVFVAGTAATAMSLHDRRDLATQAEDKGIEIGINNSIAKQPALVDDTRVRVFSVNRKVLLVGQAPNHEFKSQIDRLARQQKGVTKVYNELEIAKPIPLSQRSEDSWVSTKVRADLLSSKKVDFARLKIVTENQRIYLMGVVTSEEARLATEITRNVNGVKEVIKVFDIVDG